MRRAGWLFLGGGLLLCLVTFAGWVWLNAFACGMIPMGCKGFRLRWEDSEALSLFIPPFVAGCILLATGVALRIGHRSPRR
ncbi:hypothetical protein [Bosea sp. (in: a-proteobacteria)]